MRRARPYVLPAAIALGLIVYVGVGFNNEQHFCNVNTDPPQLMGDAANAYTPTLNNALEGKDPYAVREAVRGSFMYPPPMLVVIESFHCISSFFRPIAAYMAVNIALMVIMVYGVGRYYGHSLERSWFLFPLALGFTPFVMSLQTGQINVVTEFGIFLAFVAETAFPVVAGAGLALAICTKVTPVALLGYYLVNKRYKAIAATLAAVAVLCAIAAAHYGWAPFVTYARLFPSIPRLYYPARFGGSSLVAGLERRGVGGARRADGPDDLRRGDRAADGRLHVHHKAAGTAVHRGLPGGDTCPQLRGVSPLCLLRGAAAGLDGVEQFSRTGGAVVLRGTGPHPGVWNQAGISARI